MGALFDAEIMGLPARFLAKFGDLGGLEKRFLGVGGGEGGELGRGERSEYHSLYYIVFRDFLVMGVLGFGFFGFWLRFFKLARRWQSGGRC